MNHTEVKRGVFSGHFYSLDALRGLAALGVVVFHWQGFFYQGIHEVGLVPERQPFYTLLWPLYSDGARAVDLFFCLSGFVFYWLYSERIAERQSTLKEFAVLRFSRLYPLHFITLIVVAVGQGLMHWNFALDYVYPHNDPPHFLLQLFFVSSWGREDFYTFNGPVWSVSVEVFLYVLFFIVSYVRWNRWWHLVLCLGISRICWSLGLFDLSRGTFGFFMGGLAYQAFFHLFQRGISQRMLLGMVALTTSLWILVPLAVSYSATVSGHETGGRHVNIFERLANVPLRNSFEGVLYPVTLLTLACCEAFRGTLGKRAAFLGNISYSVYLIHFPLQLFIMLFVYAYAVPRTIFYSPITMMGFFAVLIPLGLASYHYFERPVQSLLRKKMLRRPARSRSPA